MDGVSQCIFGTSGCLEGCLFLTDVIVPHLQT